MTSKVKAVIQELIKTIKSIRDIIALNLLYPDCLEQV